MHKKIHVLSILLLIAQTAFSQLTITPNQTANAMAQRLAGNGVTVTNAVLTCPSGLASGSFVASNTNLGLDSGIILTSGTATNASGVPGFFASTSWLAGGDADLTALISTVTPTNTNDACKLEFDFVPTGDTIKFDYVFGSEEYPGFNCSFNDVFAFFISGPGIVGAPNIALVPNTNFPVAISTINNGVGFTNSPTNPCYYNTGGNGPFTQYYINNTGTTVSYNGFTSVLTATRTVIPCSTYHLKLAIADAGDWSYDSGVFLKAGSLNSNAIAVTPVGGGGLVSPIPYCVRTCLPGQFLFTRPNPLPTSLAIHYQIAGTAINGFDYTTIADSVVIPANGTSATLNIYGLPVTPTGPKTVKLYIYSPYTCGGVSTNVIDSAELTIYDSFQVSIVTPDTAICVGDSVNIRVDGDDLLSYAWTPAGSLNDSTLKEPTAYPTTTTTYEMSAFLNGAGCIPTKKSFTIEVKQPPVIDLGADRTTCLGTPFQFTPTIAPATQINTYSWNPVTNLSSGTIANPTFTPSAVGTITYIITGDPGVGAQCYGYDTINVTTLPDDFTLYNNDTAVCAGATVQIYAVGDPAFTYSWLPEIGVSNPAILSPGITPDTSRVYVVKASYPSCPDIVKSLYIDVQPNPLVFAGPDRDKCQWDTLHLNGQIYSDVYPYYSYSWTPAGDLDTPDSLNAIFSGQQDETMVLTVTTPAGCTGNDSMNIIVHQGNFASLSPEGYTAICPGDSIALQASGGVSYKWTPARYISDDTSATPVIKAETSTNYTGLIKDQYGCLDTVTLNVTVNPQALISMEDTITIYPGESYYVNPSTNCLYFNWFPPVGLDYTNNSSPTAKPEVNTKYIVTAYTEAGCMVQDSIMVLVSPESIIDMPNAFTPANAPNDIFKIGRRGIASLKYFRIFNRWGVKLFETTSIDEGWDGRFNGEPQPSGVYIYQFEAFTNTGRPVVKQGNVTLLR